MDVMEKSQRADFLFEADREAAGHHADHEDSKATVSKLCWGSSCRPAGQRRDGSRPPQKARSPPPGAWQAATKLLPR
ncbi:hypothetical protein BS78_09G066800 [Paspalum vaginatum]|nr:hypothetical protein BS78_09G066800 [Paspalum vaginatum]